MSIALTAFETVVSYAKRHNGVLPKILLCAAPTRRALLRELIGDGDDPHLSIYDVPVVVVGEIAPSGFQARGRDYWENFR